MSDDNLGTQTNTDKPVARPSLLWALGVTWAVLAGAAAIWTDTARENLPAIVPVGWRIISHAASAEWCGMTPFGILVGIALCYVAMRYWNRTKIVSPVPESQAEFRVWPRFRRVQIERHICKACKRDVVGSSATGAAGSWIWACPHCKWSHPDQTCIPMERTMMPELFKRGVFDA